MKMQANTTLFFYQKGKITTVSEKGRPRTIFRADDQPLAEQHAGDAGTLGLLATDDKGSVLNVQSNDEEEDHAYSAYGHDPSLPSLRTSSGFNGEQVDAVAAAYLLGNGYRLFNPVLMRFHTADNISPFGKGGLNAYIYCGGDPINYTDPTGHWSFFKQLTGGYGISKLSQRHSNARSQLTTLANAKKHSMSEAEYTILKEHAEDSVKYFTGKVKKYEHINRPVLSDKTHPANTRTEGLKLSQYKNDLSNAQAAQTSLLGLEKTSLGGTFDKPRYMSQENIQRHRNSFQGKPTVRPQGTPIYDANDPDFKKQYLLYVPADEIRRHRRKT